MTHPPVEILIQYALGAALAGSDAEHITACGWCRDEVRELTSTGPKPVLEMPEQLMAMQSRTDDERRIAAERLQRLDEGSLDEAVRSDPAFRTEGGFYSVIETVFAIRSRDPKIGLRVTEALLEVAEQLDDEDWSGDARAEALREAAVSHRVLGNYAEALELLERAEVAAADLVVSEFALARVWYERACLEIHREGAEARTWAEKAAEVYHRFGDQRRWNRARFLAAMSHYNQRNYEAAMAAAQELLPHIEADRDLETQAICWSMTGHALTRGNNLDSARDAFVRAIGLFEQLEMPVEELRAQWGKARTEIRQGDLAGARRELERIRDRFESFELLEETALVGLDLTECLILEGEAERARSICRESLSDLQTLFSGREQQRALAYLSELSTSGLAADEVRHVSGFLFDSMSDPEGTFLPPAH